MNQKVKHEPLWVIIFTLISLLWVFPIVIILYNSFKSKTYISSVYTFQLPNAKSFVGMANYTTGIAATNFWSVF